jgi:hypothetical protein
MTGAARVGRNRVTRTLGTPFRRRAVRGDTPCNARIQPSTVAHSRAARAAAARV